MSLGPLGGGSSRFPVAWAVAFYAALAAVAVAWRAWVDGELPLRAPGAAWGSAWRVAFDLALGVGAGLLLVALSRVWARRTRAGRDLARALAEALGPLSTRSVWALALASGIAEEAFFRGALQPRVGWILATLLFALVHLPPRRSLAVWSLFALVAGGLFGALFELTGSLVAPATAHVWVNLLNLRWLALGRAEGSDGAHGP